MSLVSFAPPGLFKFCAPEHNIFNGCNTIRVGTLWGFRDEENAHLRDEGEGTLDYKIRFPDLTPVSNEWISEIGGDIARNVHIGQMQFSNGIFSIREASIAASYANCWVFCVSTTSDAAGNISCAHNSKWTIPGEKVTDFATYIAQLLWESVDLLDLPATIRDTKSLQEIQRGLSLNAEMRPVTYRDRVIIATCEEDFPVSEVRALKESIPFIKPRSFESEREFRFLFHLSYQGKRISIENRPKILKLRPIDSLAQEWKPRA
ncbi:hypothetical protein LY44_01047 [Rhodobacter capsulatus]|nr:hypothetical protein LY44_01047 [Rhodobacter capsulatus]